MSYTLILAVVLCLCTHFPSVLSGDKVKLTDVQLLTFRQGLNTTARRSHSVPQLNCRGGSAGCQHPPAIVECHNRGTDGRDIEWECHANMNESQKLGMIQVKCEGYDNLQDEYVLEGSCSLDYTLEKTVCEGCSKDDA
ncbi:store-operated calcium entry-associated regulatory factor-like [Rhipicephalus sanguineus]|uniref:store-operated calcium entry-associated regulatory factor-like n=1 Tax=Rhipicephalus sanguineus TaxID=34632 RepID=UPI0020C2F7C1|nr:store-operated calcium entry-associated regulatory factor-like [Rhipicephalus sanguineus]